MSKFHIKENGDPGKCTAQTGNCPFGSNSEHFPSKILARKSYEKIQEKLEKLNKKYFTPTPFDESKTDSYTDGDCHELAYALWKKGAGRLFTISPESNSKTWTHMAIKLEGEFYLDGDGVVKESEILENYGWKLDSPKMNEIKTEEEYLKLTRGISSSVNNVEEDSQILLEWYRS